MSGNISDRLTKDTVQELQQMVFYNEFVKRNSNAARILAFLYPDKKYDSRTIKDALGLPAMNREGEMTNLTRKKLVSTQGHGSDRRYFLTQKGRWFALCNDLGLGFLSLCALADAYGMQSRLESVNLTGFYVYPRFTELFDGIYSENNLRKALECLKVQKLATRHTKKTLRIIPRVFSYLQNNYHSDLEDLQRWIAQVSARKDEMLECDANLVQEFRDNAILAKHMTETC